MGHLPTRLSFIGGAFVLLLLAAGLASSRPAQSEGDMLTASGIKAVMPNSTQQDKLQSLHGPARPSGVESSWCPTKQGSSFPDDKL